MIIICSIGWMVAWVTFIFYITNKGYYDRLRTDGNVRITSGDSTERDQGTDFID